MKQVDVLFKNDHHALTSQWPHLATSHVCHPTGSNMGREACEVLLIASVHLVQDRVR